MLALARSPFTLMEQMERRVEDLFGRFVEDGITPVAASAPGYETYARDGKLVIRCDVPGVDPADIRVEARGRTLTISGERKAAEQTPADDYWVRGIDYGSFERTIMLPEGIDSNAVKATYRNGILEIAVPLPEALTAKAVPKAVEQPALPQAA